jgi:uncharacterized DUF497 family protein
LEDGYTGFEWDQRKSRKTARERGFDFETAAQIFESSWFEYDDEREDYGEARYVAVGSVTCGTQTLILAVVWTPRGRKRRIISAREANFDEQETYRRFRGAS